MDCIRHALTALTLTLGLAAPAAAHEFWIEPNSYRVAPGDAITARTMIGGEFTGEELGNYPSMQQIVDVWQGDTGQPLTGPEERVPALKTPPLGPGLAILRYQSTNFQVTYDSYAKWVLFLLEAGRTDLMAQQDRDQPISEVYFRYAKSLVAVGDGQGADRFLGMPLELVALTNPYTDTGDMRLRVMFMDAPVPNAAAHVFFKDASGTSTYTRLRADAQGEIVVPATAPGAYMVNAIQILPAGPRIQQLVGAQWQSLWASMTYEIR